MSAIQNKGHITIDGYLFALARQVRTDRHIYGREESPSFVNKFSSGDPNYRDSTFFPHFVQNNWLNGFDQEKFNDGGKFYRSSKIDPTQQEKLTLQKNFISGGQAEASAIIRCQEAWRASATSFFGMGVDGDLVISVDTTDAPIDSSATVAQGSNNLTATNASFAPGQYILVIQMKGTNAGKWMKTKILSYAAGTITMEDPANVAYDSTTGVNKAQVLVLKQYSSVTINASRTWTAKAWNGTTGGILAFLCSGTCTVTGTITAVAKGFRGGAAGQGGDGTAFSGEGSGADSTLQANNPAGNGGGSKGVSSAGGGNASTMTSSDSTEGTLDGNAALTTMVMGGGGGGGQSGGSDNTDGAPGGGIILPWARTLTVTGNILANGETAATSPTNRSGSGGAGGSILIKAQTASLGTAIITAIGGFKGGGAFSNNTDGSAGRIHMDYLTSFTGTTSPTIDTALDGTLADTPVGSGFTHYVGTSTGKIYTWDGASTYTEVFDTRRVKWFDTVASGDTDTTIGDAAGTEYAQSQGFQLDTATKVKAIQVYIKTNAGTPSDLQVRIETNNAGVPSGTLADANLTKTITASTIPSTYGWVTIEFDTASSAALTASTVYHIVLKTAAASNDNNYNWKADASSPSYAGGAMSESSNGGSTWSAQTRDALFRILTPATSANCMLVSSVGGTSKLYVGTGSPDTGVNGDARLYSYDGSNWALTKTFNTTNEFQILSMTEYGSTTPKVYLGLGAKAKIYVTTDFSTFTLAKTITIPQNPGYVYALKEYNGRLYAGGGFPEQLPGNNYQYSGFLYSYDEFTWQKVGEFEHTVVKSLETFDNLLFIGTIKKRLYVYNTASIDKLFEMPWDVQIVDMKKWDDKLALALAPTPGASASGFEGIYLFDRNGFHNAFNVTSRSWYSLFVFNNNLMGGNDDGTVYQTAPNTYIASGTIQLSYFEASLPEIDKKWRSLVLQHETLPSGCSILVEYKTDESDASWTTLGTSSTVGSVRAEFEFPVGFYSKKISLRLTFATTDPSSTPTLKISDMRYVLTPDFKYLWKMTIACPDNIRWLDRSEPISVIPGAITAGQTTLTLTDGSGFPTKGRGVVIDNGVEDEFTWTGRTGNQLTGIPASGSLALGTHATTGLTAKINGGALHRLILSLKQTKGLYTFVDIDGTSYTVLFHGYQEDGFSVNQDSGIENNVPITLLEA